MLLLFNIYTTLSALSENVVFLGPPGVGKTHLASALGLVAAQHRFFTCYVNCHQLIEQLKKAHFENRIDEIGCLPRNIQGANLFFQLIARRHENTSIVFTSNKIFSQWNEVFADVTTAPAILDRVLHHSTVINIKGESCRLKERKEFMRQKPGTIRAPQHTFLRNGLHTATFAGHHKSGHQGHHFRKSSRTGHHREQGKSLENAAFSRLLWRRRWDSNPRALAGYLISRERMNRKLFQVATYRHFSQQKQIPRMEKFTIFHTWGFCLI